MKPDSEASGAAPAGLRRRGIRLFIALHMVAVGTIYAVALVVGGGFAGPPVPALIVATATPFARPAKQGTSEPAQKAQAVVPAPLPEWTQRAEIASPWESR